MTPQDDDRDDRLGDLLRRALPTGPEPDLTRLAQIRAASLLAYTSPPTTPRKPFMNTLYRAAAGLVAAAVLLTVGYFVTRGDVTSTTDYGVVVAQDGLHFTLTENGETTHIYTHLGGLLRFEKSPDQYMLVQGETTFQVDEAANLYTRGTAQYFSDAQHQQVNLLALVGFPTDASLVDSTSDVSLYRALDGSEVEISTREGKFQELKRFVLANNVRTLLTTLTLQGDPKPMPQEKFLLAKTLSEDGRVGKVSEVQGLASVKPVNATRFTPLRAGSLLMPGDWVQVDLRGANAATLKLLPQATLIVGPGGLVEVVKPNLIKLIEGEIELTPAKDVPIELVGPGDTKLTVSERGFYRLNQDKMAKVTTDPVWLKSLKGTSVNESLGSLIAQVDGRAVSLTVGVHKVTVEVRDQIARTTIEETFVNNTNQTLEGTFHFPLPQDASIAGFAMWIGNEMVEADVVEKQRAREIFEIILREKRDPGLLEWTGGNLFKARVYPIFPHSDKRVKITYTQVLPAVGRKVRYSYALQSEMLRLNPLKELSIDFSVTSATPLKAVTSPSHTVRTTKSETSARLEFAAQEHTPTKDFEAIIELSDKTPPVTLIPHRRGSDGYFLVQVTPPSGEQPTRELVTSDKPLSLVLWCDTSTSIDPAQRKTQAALVAALLTSLTPKDSFNLVASDVNADAVFEKPVPATKENILKARDILAKRVSLGWSNLERSFTAVLNMATPGTHVVYLGDGIANTVTANPQEATTKLSEAYKLAAKPVTFHSVALGSAFESGVLARLASFGGGSTRRVNGEQGPVVQALELLGEITRPPVRDVKVTFPGLRTAKVYPEVLPNLVPGTQQVILGRYLPEGQDQKGEVVVTGMQGDKEVRFTASVSLKDAEAGNSFLPRLWARLHLDKLLEQPQTAPTKEDIIGLSEEFHIMTPYTSFLVLESDADRERFKVKRRFQMRDGEAFFAEGQDKARYELAREQMKTAGLWRAGLQRNVLQGLNSLGRHPLQNSEPEAIQLGMDGLYRYSGNLGGMGGPGGVGGGGFGGGMGGKDMHFGDVQSTNGRMLNRLSVAAPAGPEAFGMSADKLEANKALEEVAEGGEPGEPSEKADADVVLGLPVLEKEMKQEMSSKLQSYGGMSNKPMAKRDARGGGGFGGRGPQNGLFDFAELAQDVDRPMLMLRGEYGAKLKRHVPQPVNPLDALFPDLPAVPVTPKLKSTWPQAALDLANLIERSAGLAKFDGAIRIDKTAEYFHTDSGLLSQVYQEIELYSPTRWVNRNDSDTTMTTIQTADAKSRSIMTTGHKLGRTRKSEPNDLAHPPMFDDDYSMTPLWQTYANYTVSVEEKNGLAILVVKNLPFDTEFRFSIDKVKKVLVQEEIRYGKSATTTITYSDFVQARGQWWATKIETQTDGKIVRRTVNKITTPDAAAFTKMCDEITQVSSEVFFLRSPAVKLDAAKKALADKTATVDDHWALFTQAMKFQQWAAATTELAAIDKLVGAKPGLGWLRTHFYLNTRRNEEGRKFLLAYADNVVTWANPGDRVSGATSLADAAQIALNFDEQMELRARLDRVFTALPKTSSVRAQWFTRHYYLLINNNRVLEAQAFLKQLITDYPRDLNLQTLYARLLFDRGNRAEAYAFVKAQIAAKPAWAKSEAESFRSLVAEWYEREFRYADKIIWLEEWLTADPECEAAAWQLLSAFVRTDKPEKAEAQAAKWIRAAFVAEPTLQQINMYRAAIRFTAGEVQGVSTERLDPKSFPLMAEAARYFAGKPKQLELALMVLRNNFFHNSDVGIATMRELFGQFVTNAAKLDDDDLLKPLNAWNYLPNHAEQAQWVKLAETLEKRWAAAAKPEFKHALGLEMFRLMIAHIDMDTATRFLRKMIAVADKNYRMEYLRLLFNQLAAKPWDENVLREQYDLIPEFIMVNEGKTDITQAFNQLMQLNDQAVTKRNAHLESELKNPEKLTRPELKAKREENNRQARNEVIAILKARETTYPEALRAWTQLERLYLEARHLTDLKPFTAEVLKLLGDKPLSLAKEEDKVDWDKVEIQDRLLSLAMYGVTRKNAAPESIDKLVKFLDAGWDSMPDLQFWKNKKFELLVALDRPKEIEADLRIWIKTDTDNTWHTALGYLLAELGRLPEAIAIFETIKEIDAEAYNRKMAIARWYMALDQKEKHNAAKLAAYKALDENTLAQMLQQKLGIWSPREGYVPPTTLDPETLSILEALVEKINTVDGYFGIMQSLYQGSKDFRIPATIADGMMGQSAGKIYAVLTRMNGLCNDIREEATVDEIMKRTEALRAKGKTPVDQRALDFLAMQMHRRASEVLNQPGTHAEDALKSFRKAYAHPWANGERILYARLLHSFGNITQAPLAAEQLKQMQETLDAIPKGSLERLQVAEMLAMLYRDRGKPLDAITTLTPVMDEFQTAHEGKFLPEVFGIATTLASFHEASGDYAKSESLWLDWQKVALHDDLKNRIQTQLNEVYLNALSFSKPVSLGTGEKLYLVLESRIIDRLKTLDPNTNGQIVDQVRRLYQIAFNTLKLPRAKDDVKKFAFTIFPELVSANSPMYPSNVQQLAGLLREFNMRVDALEFVVGCMEREPKWFQNTNRDGWVQYGWLLGQYRQELGQLPAGLEAQLLKLTLRELKADLRSMRQRNRIIYHGPHNHYWDAKEPDFAMAAEEVLVEMKDSVPHVMYIAEYLFRGCRRPGRAVDVLWEYERAKKLKFQDRFTLTQYLHEMSRYAESIPVLVSIMNEGPDYYADVRFRLMRAYFQTQQAAKGKELFTTSLARWKEKKLWDFGTMFQFAIHAQEFGLHTEAVAIYDELIPGYQREVGTANGQLADYYRRKADSLSHLGRSVEAVDAAAGAIVAWGRDLGQRQDAIAMLDSVIEKATNLEEVVKHADEETAKTGLINPILRKSFGKAYVTRKNFGPAVVQLELALEGQPNDTETFGLIISAYDALNKKPEAIERILKAIDLNRRDIAKFQNLAERYAALEDTVNAERANTSIVEATPNEAEGHKLLAEIRQKQNRWAEAIPHWEQVNAIRSLEPEGLIGLAGAQLHLKQYEAATATLQKLRAKTWPAHITDVPGRIKALEDQLPKK
jgi:predicted Zn-dependent protease